MVLDEGQPVTEVWASLDIGPTAVRRWIDQVQKERSGSTPVGPRRLPLANENPEIQSSA